MINLYSQHPTSSFVMYPDTEVSESSESRYRLQLTQSLDQSTALVIDLNRLNTNTLKNKSSVLVMEAYSGSGIPANDGQYTAKLRIESVSQRDQWGDANYLFGSYHRLWSDSGSYTGTTIAEDRAYVHGTNLQDITTYVSPNENGTYTTYNS